MYQVITGNTETRKANEHENQTKINSPSRRLVERLALARMRETEKESKREKKRETKVERKKREITGYPFDATKRIKSFPPPPPTYKIVFVFKSLDVYTEARRRVKRS